MSEDNYYLQLDKCTKYGLTYEDTLKWTTYRRINEKDVLTQLFIREPLILQELIKYLEKRDIYINLSVVNSHFRYYVLFNCQWEGDLLQLSKPYAYLAHKGQVLDYIQSNYALPRYKTREESEFWKYVLKRLNVGLLFPFDVDCLNFDWNKDKERKSW